MARAQDRALGIYIKGVTEDTTEQDCRAAFSIYGDITEVVLKGERGFALVHFSSAAEAAAAAMGGVSRIGGATVEVSARTPARTREAADAKASSNIYLKGLDEDVSREEVREALAAFGTATYIKLHTARGFAYAGMDSLEAAQAAVAASPLTIAELEIDCEIRRSRAPTKSNKPRSERAPRAKAPRDLSKEIYIKGLPEDVLCKDALMEAFGAYGEIDRVTLRRGRDFAFISYTDASAVANAVSASGGITVHGEEVLVEARKPREPREE